MMRMLFDFFLEPAQRPIIVSSPVLRRRLLGILRADLIEALALLKLCGGAKASGDRLRSSPKCRGGCSRPTESAAETGATEGFPAATATQPVRRFQLGAYRNSLAKGVIQTQCSRNAACLPFLAPAVPAAPKAGVLLPPRPPPPKPVGTGTLWKVSRLKLHLHTKYCFVQVEREWIRSFVWYISTSVFLWTRISVFQTGLAQVAQRSKCTKRTHRRRLVLRSLRFWQPARYQSRLSHLLHRSHHPRHRRVPQNQSHHRRVLQHQHRNHLSVQCGRTIISQPHDSKKIFVQCRDRSR